MTYSPTIIGASVSEGTEHLYRLLLILMDVLKKCTVSVVKTYVVLMFTTDWKLFDCAL